MGLAPPARTRHLEVASSRTEHHFYPATALAPALQYNLVLFVRADVFAVPPLVTVVADGYFSCHAMATTTAVVPFAPPLFVWSQLTLLLVDDK